MSKRLTGEEWSDDDFDGSSLSGSPPKRRKNLEDFQREQSSESGFFTKTKNLFFSVKNSLLKTFKLSPEEHRMNFESVRSETSLGMNQTNNSIYSFEMRSEPSILANNHFIVTQLPNQTQNYYVLQQNPSPQISAQFVTTIPVVMSANTSPNPSSVVLSTSSAHNMNHNLKCYGCGQVSTSPINRCRHCGFGSAKNKSMATISTNKFYKSPTRIGIGRGRARMQMSSSSMIGLTPNRPIISNVRSLSCSPSNSSNNQLFLNQRLNHLNRQNPEIIELDEENVEKTIPQQLSQESSDECLEIMDSNNTEEHSGGGVQCDNNCETIDSKNKTFDRNSNNSLNNNNNNNSNNNNNIEEILDMTAFPEYIMFGTYKTTPKTIEFKSEGIKLTNVSCNKKETKFKYHIMIPFLEMKELFYCSDETNNLLFIKPTIESNLKIQDSMCLGDDSPNGLKFNIDSEESKEHYIIIVFKEKMGERFLRLLSKTSRLKNNNIKSDQIEVGFGKHLLEIAKTGSTCALNIQLISNSKKSILEPSLGTPKRPNQFSVNRTKSNLFKSSDSSDNSPSPVRSSSSSRRSYSRTPAQTIIIDIDDDEEDIIETKDEPESEFVKEILRYPEDDKNAIHLVGTDIKCLNKGEFLNDNIVNFYLRYFFCEILNEEERQRTHIFDTLFFMQLTEKRPQKRKNSLSRDEYTFEQRYEQKLKKWTKNVDIFSKDFLVFPIIKESHWFLSIVCFPSNVNTLQQKTEDTEEIFEELKPFDKKPCIIFMDSLGNGSYKKTLSLPIRDFLALEWKSKHKTDLSFRTAKVMRDFSPLVPNQTNSSDCGLFVLEYVQQFLKSPDHLVKDLWKDPKEALIEWFDSDLVKPKRQEIRSLILEKVSPKMKERLETLIDDSKLSDTEDMMDEIGMEVMNTSVESKNSSPEEEVL